MNEFLNNGDIIAIKIVSINDFGYPIREIPSNLETIRFREFMIPIDEIARKSTLDLTYDLKGCPYQKTISSF